MRNYDNYAIFRRNKRKTVTIGQAKEERLRIKNMRRAENGLPPKKTYAEI